MVSQAPFPFGKQLNDLLKLLASQPGDLLSHPSVEDTHLKFSAKFLVNAESTIHA